MSTGTESASGSRSDSVLPGFPFKISYGAADDRLHDFYIPALSRCIRFDRTTGFFSSAALAIAAAGVARLIANGGRMRLLCGAQLSEEDVDAIRMGAELKGIVERVMVGCLADPSDTSVRSRLEALAWMVAQGALDIRVVLPKGKDGLPLPASISREYYHPKEGLFEDSEGNKLAFSGSCNDSSNGWQWNYEVFSVYATWSLGSGADSVPPLKPFVSGVEKRFTRLWEGREPDWIALEIPEAARARLLSFCPKQAPTRDPLEKPIQLPLKKAHENAEALQRERLVFRFLQEAPFLPNASSIGIETSTVKPWPHQKRVVAEVVSRYPENFLFCDEVGLGKTIEAGLALRQLVISGKVRRALLLVPKSVLRQWQEELYEKFVLNVPRYDGGVVVDVFDREVPGETVSPWDGFPLLLASSQLAKRAERQAEILAAQPWDLVIVDEAHHARRKDFLDDRYRPNRLMELLAGVGNHPGLKAHTRTIYLLTATPMQVDPVEVWDLLKLLGLGGRWGAVQENFLGFYKELRKPWESRDWDLLLSLLDDFLKSGGSLDPDFTEKASKDLGLVSWTTIKGLHSSSKRRQTALQLPPRERPYLEELLRRHTPLRTRMWRNTRALLRKYREKGLLKENVPRREPRNVWIELQPGKNGEQDLYHRIEEYITDFYQKYEAERKGLGFVMTIYRRRLTSSFAALQKSLEKRRGFLKGLTGDMGLTDDDLEQEELDRDILENIATGPLKPAKGELAYVEDFISRMKKLGTDSKFARLSSELQTLFKKFNTVLLFTQYTDTMDYLRDRLRPIFGKQVACYSGRGGELWDGVAWVPRTKEEIKEAFRLGDDIKLLLCTEAASEGVNLQTCGVLINYDMPWNPMRVEQRIGRIDRIGQTHATVSIFNYFIEDTVEAIVYKRLSDRIDWFEDVVGELQPILNKVGRTIELLTMAPAAERKARLENALAAIRKDLDEKAVSAFELDSAAEDVKALEMLPPPVTLQQIERSLMESKTLGSLFRRDPEIFGAHILTWKGNRYKVTFDPELFDRYPSTLQLLSYGNALLGEILAAAGDPDGIGGPPGGTALYRKDAEPRKTIFASDDRGSLKIIDSLQQFEESLSSGAALWPDPLLAECEKYFLDVCRAEAERHLLVKQNERRAEQLALEEEARRLILQATYVRIAESQECDLFEDGDVYAFGPDAVLKLVQTGAPFKGLRAIAGAVSTPDPNDPLFEEYRGRSAAILKKKMDAIRHRGMEVLKRYKALKDAIEAAKPLQPGESPSKIEPSWLKLHPSRAPVSLPAQEEAPRKVLKFRKLPMELVQPFKNAVPLLELKMAAGLFSAEQAAEENLEERFRRDPSLCSWVELQGRTKPALGLFVAQVIGESMNRRVPNGSHCVFKIDPAGSRNGRVVLAQLRDVSDPETGGRFTVKIYESEKDYLPDGTWRHKKVLLKPDSTDPEFNPIVLENPEEGTITVIAEMIEVLE